MTDRLELLAKNGTHGVTWEVSDLNRIIPKYKLNLYESDGQLMVDLTLSFYEGKDNPIKKIGPWMPTNAYSDDMLMDFFAQPDDGIDSAKGRMYLSYATGQILAAQRNNGSDVILVEVRKFCDDYAIRKIKTLWGDLHGMHQALAEYIIDATQQLESLERETPRGNSRGVFFFIRSPGSCNGPWLHSKN